MQALIVEALRAPLSNQAMIEKNLTAQQRALAANFTKALGETGAPSPGRVAEACGVTEQAVSNWKRTGKIASRHLLVVSRLTGWSLSKLLTGEDPPPTGPKVNMKERRMSDSEWATLQHLRVLPEEERLAEQERLAARAKIFEAYADEVLRRAKGED